VSDLSDFKRYIHEPLDEALRIWIADGSVHEPGCLIDPETRGGCDCFTSMAAALLARLDGIGNKEQA
jgi:hypothetical protein